MPSPNNQPNDPQHWSFQLSLRMGQHSWSDLDIWTNDHHEQIQITHIFENPFTIIANALLAIQNGQDQVEFDLHDEPGMTRFTLLQDKHSPQLLVVSIANYKENFHVTSVPLKKYEFITAKDFFIDSFLSELVKIQQQLTYPDFARGQDTNDFPWDTIKKIKKCLKK